MIFCTVHVYGRSHSPFLKMVTTSTLDDGNSWRKYGQKHIQDSTNPRYILYGLGRNSVYMYIYFMVVCIISG